MDWYLISHLLTSYDANKEATLKYGNTKLAIIAILPIAWVCENPSEFREIQLNERLTNLFEFFTLTGNVNEFIEFSKFYKSNDA